ncbi:MAG: SDR family oxidoreductase [Kiritimatiellae bacterium]|nr:SDR family oxidoreductase [Kiritimatiellia bacterium]MDW8458817.1 SDR family oxidoreductase [Verrucomicrobiota bacterium]
MEKANFRTIVVTGATRGLGLAMAEGFIARGHTVVGCGRDAARISALRARFGAPHRFDVCDVSNADSVRRWADAVLASHGPPDLLVNNAAIMLRPAPLWEIDPAEFARITAININGSAFVIRFFVPAMVAARRGVIVNFSSGWGRSTDAHVAPYCATKWAVEGLTQALAQELPRGIVAVALNPGIIDTDMLRQCWGDDARNYPSPTEWAQRAVPFILGISARDNGRALTVPGVPT